MQPSIAGLVVFAGILGLVYLGRYSLIVGLMISLSFGSTALVTLPSLGGSSPLIYTAFALLLVVAAVMRRDFWRDIGTLFAQVHSAWVVFGLLVYAAISAVILPRLFAGQTSVFVASRTGRGVYETALEPVSGNISQTAYFILGGTIFFAVSILLLRRHSLEQVRKAFLLWAGLHTAMGLIDLFGKITGMGDVLAPIRSASYARLTDVSEAGFWRIAGAHSEASAFAGVSLACLAFAFTDWRRTGSRLALWLWLILLVLLLLSTSSTGYVGLGILSLPVAFSIARSLLVGRLVKQEILLVVLTASLCLVAIVVVLFNAKFFDPFMRLIDTMVINKASSGSGQERAYWNYKSLQAFFDTGGLGIGLGSSRASSWPIAVLSQLGFVGALMTVLLVTVIARGIAGLHSKIGPDDEAVVSSVRAAALAGFVSGSLISGTADPGIVFFVALAVISVSRLDALRRQPDVQPQPGRLVQPQYG